MGKKQFYSNWIHTAFSRSIGIGDGVGFLVGIIFPLLYRLVPNWETALVELAWQIPLGIFGSVVLLRLLLSPYWIWKDVVKEKDRLEQELNKQNAQDFAVIWLEEEKYWKRSDDISNFYLQGSIQINTIKRRLVSSMELEIDNCLYSAKWKDEDVYTPAYSWGTMFKISENIQRGRKRARLRCVVDGSEVYSESFTLELPKCEDLAIDDSTIEPPMTCI